MRRIVFSTASLRARFHRKLAQREAFQKVSLRASRAWSAFSLTLPGETCAKMATREAQSASSHTLPAETCANWPTRPPWRGEKQEKKLLSAYVSTGNWRGEKQEKNSLHTGFGFARPCQKGTLPHVPHLTSPRPTPPCPTPPRTTPHHTPHTMCWHTGHPWPS